LASVAVTVYEPAARPPTLPPVAPPGLHAYVYGAAPPLADALADALAAMRSGRDATTSLARARRIADGGVRDAGGIGVWSGVW